MMDIKLEYTRRYAYLPTKCGEEYVWFKWYYERHRLVYVMGKCIGVLGKPCKLIEADYLVRKLAENL